MLEPLKYLERVKKCKADIVFLALNHLEHPCEVLEAYLAEGIPTGISISNLDLDRDPETLKKLLKLSGQIVVVTNRVGDRSADFNIPWKDSGRNRGYLWGSGVAGWKCNLRNMKELEDRNIYSSSHGRSDLQRQGTCLASIQWNNTQLDKW